MTTERLRAVRWGWWLALLACGVGIGLAAELAHLHLRLKADPTFQSFCNINSSINCDETATSSYSVLFGLPVALWGVMGYSAILAVCLTALLSRRRWVLVPFAGLAAFSAATTPVFALLSWFGVKSFCLLCACSWLTTFVLLGLALAMARRGRLGDAWQELVALVRANRRRWVMASAGILAALVLVLLGTVSWWSKAHARALASAAEISKKPAVPTAAKNSGMPHGVEDGGHHYLGAKQPEVTVVEFSDYQCPFCARAHGQLRALVAKQPERVRLVHRHFPLDNACNPAVPQPFHAHSCLYAKMAACAGTVGEFWAANDYLFAHGRDREPITIAALAKALALDEEGLSRCVEQDGATLIRGDIQAGNELRIEGTPTFVVDGQAYVGTLPAEVKRKHNL